ncbi:MAG: FAD-dependent oxidoreductase [Acidobacteriota bacterium]|nr:MAG: FAD-dependent oxidoreductase [Acidobacteriota bacterium]
MNSEPFVSRDIIDRKWVEVNVPCQSACPIQTDIPGYIEAIIHEDYEQAYLINRLDNVFPGVLGRVCHRPCEPECRHGREGLGEPVQICFLKRSAADFGMEDLKPDITPNGKTVCVIGAGPAGLTAANDLALLGYKVTVLEQYEEPGGMMRYGIPQFRLPADIVRKDIKSITDLGVEIKCNTRVDSWEALDDLKAEYDAVIVSGGCMLPTMFGLPGKDAEGVFWGLDFMMQANRDELEVKPKTTVVIGGGFTALDCARTSYRIGAEATTIAYRRTIDYMQFSGEEELHHLAEEEIDLQLQVSPVEVVVENGRAVGIKLIKNEIGEGGKMSPVEGSEYIIEADTIILAIGQTAEELEGVDVKDESVPEAKGNLFLAGDFRNGSGTVIGACADGRKVGRQVHEQLSGEKFEEIVEISEVPIASLPRNREHDFLPQEKMPTIPVSARTQTAEVETGLLNEQAITEAHRCYLCHYNFQIDLDRCIYCMKCIDVMPVDCIHLAKDITVGEDGDLKYERTKNWEEVEAIAIDNDECIRCGNCLKACPVHCISVSKYHYKTVVQPVQITRDRSETGTEVAA